MSRKGYTLSVFAVAAAKAALLHLQEKINSPKVVNIDLLPEEATIPIQQVAILDSTTALAITISDPGDNLDITRNTPIWAQVKLQARSSDPLILKGGEGLGKTITGDAAIYSYARRLFDANVLPLIPTEKTLTVTIILPFGRQLAQRTSNESFGILEGLSLLGTSGISQPLSAAEYLEEFRQDLQKKVKNNSDLVFCIGSSGIEIARKLGTPETSIVQTGNWIGAMLVEAGLRGANSIILLGYQGKLIKLAGGIFNTSSHIADGKLEIISAAVASVGGSPDIIKDVLNSKTADDAYKILVNLQLAEFVFAYLADKITHKATAYVKKYADVSLEVSTILLNRQGKIIAQSTNNKSKNSTVLTFRF